MMITLAMAVALQSVAWPRADLSGTGPGVLAYHSISADCGRLVHSHGRNGVWGTWSALLPEASVTFETADDGAPTVLIRCREGWACIREERNGRRGDLVSHAIPFADAAGAQAYVARLTDVMPACGRETAG